MDLGLFEKSNRPFWRGGRTVGACTPLRGGGIGSSAKGRLSAGGPPERAAGEDILGGSNA